MQNEEVFPLIVYGTSAVYVLSGVLSMFSRPNLYDQIGQGGLSAVGEDGPGGGLRERAAAQATARSEREQEVRQMLQARSDRLVRRGRPPLDVDAELARLDRLAASRAACEDEALVEEVRQLVIVRNERRMRQGQRALDVDNEIARTLAELDLQS